ncbi:uncharacterized protein LOC124135721 [Haliotis rufescens]|uniref:uncharacterized protein LOC124135721 n=1 Tax=Haliotis rufescens TaxID=6454 RepID=UPI001EAFFE89|nr:uncharacterized protein LOC124135721 [Haliotis rufescens]XP_046357173.1 uncharacterized protein LOC124135721 [Haliotis rufescens]
MEPSEVTVVVHGARGLQGKKAGRCKFSVIFGVGSKKYRTSIVKDPPGNPDWNEESTVNVGYTGDHVFFTVTEKEDILGQVIVPLAGLTTTQGQVKRVFLKSHKKCLHPQGELIYQCYVSKQRPVSQTPLIKTSTPNSSSGATLTGFARLRHNLAASPILPPRTNREKRDSKSSSSLSNFNKKLSKSIHDIFSFGKSSDDDDTNSRNQSKFGWKFKSNTELDASSQPPVISAINPNIAPIEGGTKLRISGQHLGIGKSDLIELQLCGCDLLNSVEYESENAVTCVTNATTPGKGDLWIETVSGGQSVLKNVFTFVDTSVALKEDDNGEAGLAIDSGTTSLSLEDSHVPTESSIPVQPKTKPPTPMPRKESQYTSNSLPRIKSSDNMEGGRFKKNFMKHVRRSSESSMLRDVPERRSTSKAELKEQVEKLQKENQTLKENYTKLQLENKDMRAYIDRLLTKVLVHCPEALESDPPTF